MAKGPTYRVDYRREREQKTNYKKRIKILHSGLPRLVVRPSNRHMLVQIVAYEENGDAVMASATSKELAKYGWTHGTGNLPASYLTGLLCSLKGIRGKLPEAIVDFGMGSSIGGSRAYAAVKGVLDGGLNVRHDEKVLPPEERLSGAHIGKHVQKSKDISTDFIKTKERIKNGFK
jgi:large subunit ribosomal protein L18